MALNPGTRLGVYEVAAKIGEGGMGEVYQARDTKLDRDVALKVLPAAFTADPDRLARFEREAKVLASLNHPNIASIYGLEESGQTRALVLELVEGPTLAERITGSGDPSGSPIRGSEDPRLPVEEALTIARQIAEALEAAHEQGIIHRDLKPANIKVREDGTVKVLDFGLAKALDSTAASGTTDPLHSPTLTAAATQMGVILGTAAYMSPEQAKGKTVDKRADVWAFGAVLFEMLTGARAFVGDDVSDTLAAVLRAEPSWDRLPNDLPPALATYLRRCLHKDPGQRVRDIGDVRLALDGAFDLSHPAAPTEPGVLPDASGKTGQRIWMAMTTIMAVVVLAALSVAVSSLTRTPIAPTTRFSVLTEGTGSVGSLALSPDGTQLAFVTGPRGQLWVRSIDTLEPRTVPGAMDAGFPFWSPDGRSIGFFTLSELKTVDLTGGPPQTVAQVPIGVGGTWGEDNVILFGQFGRGLSRIPAAGGEPTPVTTLDEVGGVSHAWPQFLPDGDHFLFVTTSLDPQEAGIRIGSLETGNVSSPIVQTGFMARFAAPGYLLFDRGGALMAQRFDTDQLELTGDPVRVVDGVLSDPTLGSLGVSTSDRGGLAYVPAAGSTLTQLRWLDRSGNELGTVGAPGDYQNPVLSPDERRVAVQRDGDIWLLDLERGTDQRFTFDPADDQWPVWSPDGDRILFASARETRPFDLYLKGTAGTDPAQLLLETDELKVPFGWSTDGEQVSFTTLDADYDLWLLPMSGDRQPTSFLSTPFQDASGVISPDGHWMAYWSDESVEFRVYVRTVPPSGGQWQISTAAGFAPRWSADGRELYWTTENNQLMAVDIDVTGDAPIVIGTPQQLFEAPFRQTPIQRNVFDVSADGERFLVNTLVEGALSAPITWVHNWPAELEPAP